MYLELALLTVRVAVFVREEELLLLLLLRFWLVEVEVVVLGRGVGVVVLGLVVVVGAAVLRVALVVGFFVLVMVRLGCFDDVTLGVVRLFVFVVVGLRLLLLVVVVVVLVFFLLVLFVVGIVTRLLVVRANVWMERPWEEMKSPVVSPTLPTALRTCRWIEEMRPSLGIFYFYFLYPFQYVPHDCGRCLSRNM